MIITNIKLYGGVKYWTKGHICVTSLFVSISFTIPNAHLRVDRQLLQGHSLQVRALGVKAEPFALLGDHHGVPQELHHHEVLQLLQVLPVSLVDGLRRDSK